MQAVIIDTKTYKALNRYKHRYLNKRLENLDESSTRIITNHLLADVLGYKELIDIRTEYPIQGGYIDYLIQIDQKNLFVVEVKSIRTKLAFKHVRQAIYYGATTGVEWIVLTNSRQLELYKLSYSKPIKITKVASIDLKHQDLKSNYLISCLSKKSVMNGSLKLLDKLELS